MAVLRLVGRSIARETHQIAAARFPGRIAEKVLEKKLSGKPAS
jgi:hypothetical protein